MGTLSLVATPIGNLEDITLRALRILKESDFILAEDTRVTKKLLDRYSIEKPLISYHQHSDSKKVQEIIGLLSGGKNLALVTDAGTPGISDPGNELVAEVVHRLPEGKIVPIPGAAALVAASSVSGFPMDKFVFMGFPPVKNKRRKFFEEVGQQNYPVILYESSHRIVKTLREIGEFLPRAQIVVARELTKKFETVYRGTASEVLGKLERDSLKGEFVIIAFPQTERG